jgi:hypothetical protein
MAGDRRYGGWTRRDDDQFGGGNRERYRDADWRGSESPRDWGSREEFGRGRVYGRGYGRDEEYGHGRRFGDRYGAQSSGLHGQPEGGRGYEQISGYGREFGRTWMDEGRVQGGGAWQSRGEHAGRGPKGYTRSDDRIREDVCDRLTDDPSVDASDIEVKVSNCEVTLSGTVDRREAKRRAEDCAEQVSGVRNVQNNLRVQERASEAGGDSGRAGHTAARSSVGTGSGT